MVKVSSRPVSSGTPAQREAASSGHGLSPGRQGTGWGAHCWAESLSEGAWLQCSTVPQLHTVPHLVVDVLATHHSRYKIKMQVEKNRAQGRVLGASSVRPCQANFMSHSGGALIVSRCFLHQQWHTFTQPPSTLN